MGLDDAGYDSWSVHAQMFKGMIMNAFPPLDKLNNEKATIESVASMRQVFLSFSKVLDMHITSAEVTGSIELDDPAGSLQKIAWLSRVTPLRKYERRVPLDVTSK